MSTASGADRDKADLDQIQRATDAAAMEAAASLRAQAHDSSSETDPRDESRPQTWQIRFVRRLPLHLIATPERVVLNVAFIFTGIAGIIPPRGQVLDAMPPSILIIWTTGMIVGGSAVLLGLFRNFRPLERVGYLLVLIACVFYAGYTVYERGLPGLPIALVFLGFAVMKVIRLIISSAEREMVLEIGRRMRDRQRHTREQDDREGDAS